MIHLQTLDCSGNEAIAWLQQQLHALGLTSLVSFDSRTMRHGQSGLPCPRHGDSRGRNSCGRNGRCDCQIIILLVYDADAQPATLVLHGASSFLTLSLVDTPQQRPLPQLRTLLYQNFQPEPDTHSVEATPSSMLPPTKTRMAEQESATRQVETRCR